MLLSDFDYDLPLELIAQEPAPERASSRLLVIDRASQQFSHARFADIPRFLPAKCLLGLNDTRVFPARLRGRKETGGAIEVLLLRRVHKSGEVWEVLCKGGQSIRARSRVRFAPELTGEWLDAPREGRGVLQFFCQDDFWAVLDRVGEVPLPPYIKREAKEPGKDRDRYQTVYARHVGAVAAPTAGLHFSEELLEAVRQRGIDTVFVTLHVGAGTFQPIRSEEIERHRMEDEEYVLTDEVAERLNLAKQAGKKIIAVGTTTTRALESAATAEGMVRPGHHRTNLFIYPGYRFRVIDGLITNFHLPRSTLLLLVSAFAGRELILKAYAEAVAQRYRFYSYGDAMLIL